MSSKSPWHKGYDDARKGKSQTPPNGPFDFTFANPISHSGPNSAAEMSRENSEYRAGYSAGKDDSK